MARANSTVAFEDRSVDQVRKAVLDVMGPHVFDISWGGIFLSVANFRAEYDYIEDFMATRGFEDSNPFFRDFDIKPFSTELEVSCSRGRPFQVLLPMIADILAKTISKTLRTRALVMIEDGEVPYKLYNRGKVERELSQSQAEPQAGE